MKTPINASIGAVAWLTYAFVEVRDLRADTWAHALLLFAALVLLPLALDLFAEDNETPQSTRIFATVRHSQLPAALLLLTACWMPQGIAALALSIPWAIVTASLAVIGVLRLRHSGFKRSLDGLCRDAALIFAAVGGAWTLTDRGGFRPLGFDPAIVALTAVHFHYAGLLLPLFAGLVERELWFLRFAARAAVGVILGVPAVAVGITAAQLGWGGSLEAAAGTALALAGMAVAILQVRIALEARRPPGTRALLGIAGVALFFAMVLAGSYALRSSGVALPWLGIPQMRMLHGTVNAFGFGFCGVLGWRRMAMTKPVER